MKQDKKVRVTYSLSPASKKYIEDMAEKEDRTVSNYLDRVISKLIEQDKSDGE